MSETTGFLITSGVLGLVINLCTHFAKKISKKIPFEITGQMVLAVIAIIFGGIYAIVSFFLPEDFRQNFISVTVTAMTFASGIYGIFKPFYNIK